MSPMSSTKSISFIINGKETPAPQFSYYTVCKNKNKAQWECSK